MHEPVPITEQLAKVGGLSAIYEVSRFLGVRKDSQGHDNLVTIEVRDAGPDAEGGLRYHVVATDERGRRASGNSHGRLEAAIAMVHWGDLDEEPTA